MSTRSSPDAMPPFLVLAAHPLRWRLLVELAESDRRVGELCGATGARQALVSYHLARLRSGGLVSSRRSAFDGRAAYYRVHLDRCGQMLAAAGGALHPALRPAPVSGPRPLSVPSARHRVRVLFACTGNSARSQIAEAILRDRVGAAVEVASAGSDPKPIHPNAVRVLSERGIDIAGARSKSFADLGDRPFDHVVTLCDRVREVCPEFPGPARAVHWSVEDPNRTAGTARATLPVFRRTATDIEERVGFLIAGIVGNPSEYDTTKERTRHAR